MRKNMQQTLASLEAGKYLHPARAAWTDGETVYSYGAGGGEHELATLRKAYGLDWLRFYLTAE